MAKSCGNFMCVDMWQDQTLNANLKHVKPLFTSEKKAGAHTHNLSCIQWFPLDNGETAAKRTLFKNKQTTVVLMFIFKQNKVCFSRDQWIAK